MSLERHPQGPTKDILVEYRGKVDFLKKVLESRASMASNNKNNTNNIVNNKSCDVVDVAGGTRRRSIRSLSPPGKQTAAFENVNKYNFFFVISDVSEIIRPIPVLPHGPAATSETITKEIHQKTVEQHNEQMRKALFGVGDAPNAEQGQVRKRTNLPEQTNDLDYLLKAHHQAQEQVADEMLSLTKSLKEQSLAAKEVILKDTAVIEKANTVADKNTDRLKNEMERLQEHTKSSCRCWIWLLIVIVTVTFIGE